MRLHKIEYYEDLGGCYPVSLNLLLSIALFCCPLCYFFYFQGLFRFSCVSPLVNLILVYRAYNSVHFFPLFMPHNVTR